MKVIAQFSIDFLVLLRCLVTKFSFISFSNPNLCDIHWISIELLKILERTFSRKKFLLFSRPTPDQKKQNKTKQGDLLAKVEEDGLEDEDGSGGAEDGQRLAGEDAVDDAAQETRDERLHGAEPVVGGVAEQAAERDQRRQARKVQERERGDALQRQRVFVIRPVPAPQKKKRKEKQLWFGSRLRNDQSRAVAFLCLHKYLQVSFVLLSWKRSLSSSFNFV